MLYIDKYYHLVLKHFFRIIPLLFALLANINLHAQITHPLFMQIKNPKLESNSGIEIAEQENTFLIDTHQKDSVNISFVITVPKEMLSDKWAISLTPTIQSPYTNGTLKDVVVKGWRFTKQQNEDYDRYNEFINSIIDRSLYEEKYIHQKRLEREIEQRHDEFWKYYYDEWERQIEYEIWKSKQDGSQQTYSVSEKSTYRQQLLNQYLLRIENQSKRYLQAGMDTTGLHKKYMDEFKAHIAKMPRFFVDKDISINKVPNQFKDIYESGRTLDDITDAMHVLLVERDSALMSLPVLDYDKIIENEKRKLLEDRSFQDIIRLPKNENAVVDTTIYNLKTDYTYTYTYRYPVIKNNNDTVTVRLKSKVLGTDQSGFTSTSENVLTYIITDISKSSLYIREEE